jgi:SP family sugar:H+ symporter-like MFS transporter
MIALLTPIADDGIGYSFGYVLVGTNLMAAAIVWFLLFEPVSLSLENVSEMYAEPNLKPWTSSKWVPEGYTTRRQRIAAADKGVPSGGRFSDETARPGSGEGMGMGQVKQTTDVRTEAKQTV